MAALAKLDGSALENALGPLVDEYSGWIDEQRDVDLEREALGKTRAPERSR
jgi:hypothetical protein